MARHPHMQRLQPLKELEGVKGRQAGAGIAQQRNPHLEDIGEATQCFPVLEPMIGGVRLGKFREFAVIPGKLPTVNDSPANTGSMSANELGQGIDHDIRPMIQRFEQTGGRYGVIDDKGDSGLVGYLCDGLEVIHIVLGVTHRLGIDQTCVFVDGPTDVLRVGSIYKLH